MIGIRIMKLKNQMMRGINILPFILIKEPKFLTELNNIRTANIFLDLCKFKYRNFIKEIKFPKF